MDDNYEVGRKVKCVKQPQVNKNLLIMPNLIGLPGKITEIIIARNVFIMVDFGEAGEGEWLMLSEEINLIPKEEICNSKKKKVPVSS